MMMMMMMMALCCLEMSSCCLMFSLHPFGFVNVLYCDFNAMMLLSVFMFINIMVVIIVMLW